MSLALRAAIAMHPAAWREKHADAVVGTLMDVADDRGGRIPLAETANLALRGLWLRARGSVTFWAVLLIVVVMVASALSRDLYDVDGSLTAHLLKLNGGLGVVLLVLGTLGGWTGARARTARISGVGARLRRLAVDSVPPLIVTAAACLIAFTIVCGRFGAPWIAWPAGLVVASQMALVLAALAIGELLGAALPRVLVIFVAPAVVAILVVGWMLPLQSYQSLAYLVDVVTFVRGLVATAVLLVLAVVSAGISSLWVRALPALGLVAVSVFLLAALPASGQGWTLPVERPRSELVCSTPEPIVCLWPEQDAAFGDSLRAELSEAYATGTALGLPVDDAAPRSVARYAMTGIPAPDCVTQDGVCDNYPASNFGLGVGGIAPRDVISLYASSITSSYWEAPTSGQGDMYAVQFAVAIVLGVDRDRAWPPETDPYTGQPVFDHSTVPDEAAARALVERWLTVGVNGLRAP